MPPPASRSSVTAAASVRAASRNIRSEMTRVSAAIAPSPRPGKTNDVVRLADRDGPPVHLDRVERRPGGDDRPALGPAQDVDRRGLGGRRRVGQRQHDRPRGPGRRGPDDLLGERAADPGRADQDGRPDPFDGLEQRRELGREAVVGEGAARQGEFALGLVEVLAPVVDLAARVDQDEGTPDVGLGHALAEHRQAEQPGDADPGRSRADEDDTGVGKASSGGRGPPPGHPRPRPQPCPGCRR